MTGVTLTSKVASSVAPSVSSTWTVTIIGPPFWLASGLTVIVRLFPDPPNENPSTITTLLPALALTSKSSASSSTSVTVNDNAAEVSSSKITCGVMLAVITGGSFTASTFSVMVADKVCGSSVSTV